MNYVSNTQFSCGKGQLSVDGWQLTVDGWQLSVGPKAVALKQDGGDGSAVSLR
ncbi:hypothetical protein [Microcoleus sp. herbarium14]|uniref:hypothetical protein n=1 Tax=Microcoleus sp. herbarium14 TaxID=3055439 RepID=UPI002FD214D6